MSPLDTIALGFASGVLGGVVYVKVSDWWVYHQFRRNQRKHDDPFAHRDDSN